MRKKRQDCNSSLLEDVVKSTGEATAQVRNAVSFFSEYLANMISDNSFETLIVPYFGKFQPKTKELQYTMDRKGVTRQPKKTDEGTIHDNTEL